MPTPNTDEALDDGVTVPCTVTAAGEPLPHAASTPDMASAPRTAEKTGRGRRGADLPEQVATK